MSNRYMKKAYIRFCSWAACALLGGIAVSCGTAKKSATTQDTAQKGEPEVEEVTPETKEAPDTVRVEPVRPDPDQGRIRLLYGVPPEPYKRLSDQGEQK